MALIAVAADKGAPGVTTASVALAAVWPRPVLLAECDPAGGDIAYGLPGADGSPLDPRRGLLSLAVAARRGLQPDQVWQHAQKLHGGLDVLAGVTSAEQGSGLEALWDTVGGLLARIPQADVIADCGRLGRDGPFYDLLAHAEAVVLITRASLAEVIRLRDRAAALASALQRRGRPGARIAVVVVADHKTFKTAIAEVGQAIGDTRSPARVIGGLAYEPKSASQLRGQWAGKLDKSLLIRTAREIAGYLAAQVPPAEVPDVHLPGAQRSNAYRPDVQRPDPQRPAPQRSDSQRSDAVWPDVERPRAQVPDAQMSDTQRRLAAQRPDAPWPDAEPPGGQRPEAQRPAAQPPAAQRPGGRRPGTAGSGPRHASGSPRASAGPAAAGPLSAGPLSAGPLSAGPLSAGPLSGDPLSAGPPSATILGGRAAQPGEPGGW
jgi:hypothetical protein